jgi:hypothetical protein
MYFKLTRKFLEGRTKDDLIDMFGRLDISSKLTKTALVTEILNHFSKSTQLGMQPWGMICCFCRREVYFAGTGLPRYCPGCGRTSPKFAHEAQLERATHLVAFASQNMKNKQRQIKDVLLEQAVVVVITGLEVLMREVYALVYDHQHVAMGTSIYDDTYAKTRSEFLNLGMASRGLRKVTSLNIKERLPANDYKFLSRMYSARHIIVHNSSSKDRDFLSQTGDPESELGRPLMLYNADLRRLIKLARLIARQIDEEFCKIILACHHDRLSISRLIRKKT